jgi:hypothetical protein
MPEWVVEIKKGKIIDDLKFALAEAVPARLGLEQRVDCYNGMRIDVYSNEHPPPHFRAICGGVSQDFDIETCNPRHDKYILKVFKGVRDWHFKNKSKLISVWNKRRPTNCPVGEYRSPEDREKAKREGEAVEKPGKRRGERR